MLNMVVISCCAQTYVNETMYTTSEITFDTNNNYTYFVLWSHSPLLFGDTLSISYGKYVKYENKAYYLFSSPESPWTDINCDVTESKINLKDSFIITFSSPFDSLITNLSMINNQFIYCITMHYKSSNNAKDTSCTYYTTSNKIELHKPFNMNLAGFKIDIVPYRIEGDIDVHYLSSNYYAVNDIESNCFFVNFPDFSYQRFYYHFVYYFPVPVIDKNSIALDGKIFQIKPKKIKHYKKIGKWYYDYFNARDPYADDIENINLN